MNRLPNEPDPSTPDEGEITVESNISPEATEIATETIDAFWKILCKDGRTFSAADLVEALVEFNVNVVKMAEEMPGMPPHFRYCLLTNLPIGLCFEDARRKGVNASALLRGLSESIRDETLGSS